MFLTDLLRGKEWGSTAQSYLHGCDGIRDGMLLPTSHVPSVQRDGGEKDLRCIRTTRTDLCEYFSRFWRMAPLTRLSWRLLLRAPCGEATLPTLTRGGMSLPGVLTTGRKRNEA